MLKAIKPKGTKNNNKPSTIIGEKVKQSCYFFSFLFTAAVYGRVSGAIFTATSAKIDRF